MINLIPLGEELLLDLARDPVATLGGFASNGADVAPVAHKVANATLDMQAKTGAVPPWSAYFALRDGDHALVGACQAPEAAQNRVVAPQRRQSPGGRERA